MDPFPSSDLPSFPVTVVLIIGWLDAAQEWLNLGLPLTFLPKKKKKASQKANGQIPI